MNILVTKTYEEQLKQILEYMLQKSPEDVSKFKMYLDTILINMPTKAKKYKVSKLFNDEEVREIKHENFIIPFYFNEEKNSYTILGIIEN